jgi:hypothetical protein
MSDTNQMNDEEFERWFMRYRPEALRLAREMLGLESALEMSGEVEHKPDAAHAP